MIFRMVQKKNWKSYVRLSEKWMFLNLTYCFILTFSQWHLVNLGVQKYLSMPEIRQILDICLASTPGIAASF